jgi:hypothetical protein
MNVCDLGSTEESLVSRRHLGDVYGYLGDTMDDVYGIRETPWAMHLIGHNEKEDS